MRSIIDFVKKYKLIIATAIVSTTVIMAIIFLFTNYQKNKIYKKVETQIIELSQNIIKAYQIKPNYWGLSTNDVINKNLYASGMSVDNQRLIGYFGEEIEIGADDKGSPVMPTEKKFVIAYKKLTKNQCIGMLSQKFNKTFWLAVNKITVKNNTFSQDFTWGNANFALPITREKLKKTCDYDKTTIIMQF